MIWADRVGVVLLLLAGLLYLSDQNLDPELVFGWIALAPWLALRALDFIARGVIRLPGDPV